MSSDKISLLALIISILSFFYSLYIGRKTSVLSSWERKNRFLEKYLIALQGMRASFNKIQELKVVYCERHSLDEYKEIEDKARKNLAIAEGFYSEICDQRKPLLDSTYWESKMHLVFKLQKDIEDLLDGLLKIDRRKKH